MISYCCNFAWTVWAQIDRIDRKRKQYVLIDTKNDLKVKSLFLKDRKL